MIRCQHLLISMAFAVLVGVLPAHASNASQIKALSSKLSNYTYGGLFCAGVRGNSTDMMLKDYALRIKYSNPHDVRIQNYPRSLPTINDDLALYGLARADAATNMMSDIADMFDENDSVFDATQVRKVMADLKRAGALIGYTSDGIRACGNVYPSVLIIDQDNRKIYELTLASKECSYSIGRCS